jgi:hypothetical protein
MTPAQRRKKLRDLRKNKTSKKLNFFLLLLLLFIFVILGLFFFAKKHCIGNLKISMVFPDEKGNVIVSTLSKKDSDLTLIEIPSNTQLESSRQLGTWKANSLWQLGINEKHDGKLLQETVTKNFHFPVTIWADKNVSGFVSGNIIKIIKSALFPYKSNLSIGDRLNLLLLAFSVKNEKTNNFDLSKMNVLKKTKLTDGEEGYVIINPVPVSVLSSFSESIDTKFNYMAQIVNATGSRLIAENVGKTIESMGYKITSIKEEYSIDNLYDCVIYGKNKDVVNKISQIYSCEIDNSKNSEEFDIVLRLGKEFSKRY